ncbi:MAG: hypothetical protein WDW38_009345 [Sanguina aurantia]
MKEVATQPSDFSAKLSCLLLDQMTEQTNARAVLIAVSAADAAKAKSLAAAAAAASEKAHGDQPVRIAKVRSELLALCSSVNGIMGVLHVCKAMDLARVFLCPAVISLYKSILMTSINHQRTSLTPFEQESMFHFGNFNILSSELNHLLLDSDASDAEEAFLRKRGKSSDHLLPNLRPSSPVSDLDLIQALLARTKVAANCPGSVATLYGLAGKVVMSWGVGTSDTSPFPNLSAGDQVRGAYLVAHHCIAASKGWMQHQQYVQRGRSTVGYCASSRQDIVTGLQKMMSLVFANRSLRLRFSALEKDYVTAPAVVQHQLIAHCDPMLWRLQQLLHTPGTLQML